MTELERILYAAKAHTTGGRDNGVSRTDDGGLQMTLSRPDAPVAGTNPEQLFAAGWSAGFLSAVQHVAGKRKIALPSDAEVDLGLAKGVHNLAARLNGNQPGVDQQTARSPVRAASHVCPYSRATSGNIAVTYNAITSPAGETQHA